MAQVLLHGLNIVPGADGSHGIGVTQVVEPNVGQASGVQQGLQMTVCGTGIGGGFGLQRIREDPLWPGMFFSFRQKPGGTCW